MLFLFLRGEKGVMKQSTTINLRVKADLQDAESRFKQLKTLVNSIQLPSNSKTTMTTELNNILQKVEKLKELSANPLDENGYKQAIKLQQQIESSMTKLGTSINSVSNASKDKLKNLIPKSNIDTVKKLDTVLNQITQDTKSQRVESDKVALALEKQKTKYDEICKKQKELKSYTKEQVEDANNAATQSNLRSKQGAAKRKMGKVQAIMDSSAAHMEEIKTATGNNKNRYTHRNDYRTELATYKTAQEEYKEAEKTYNETSAKLREGSTIIKLQDATVDFSAVEQSYKAAIDRMNALPQDLDFTPYKEALKDLDVDIDIDSINSVKDLQETIKKLSEEDLDKTLKALPELQSIFSSCEPSISNMNDGLREAGRVLDDFKQKNAELANLRNRMLDFFGISNSIQLFKTAVRDAYQAISELDAEMTEMAVVTDYSISDLWNQLPYYTQQANELGVATKEAYAAATLYYQQGLNTNQVNSLTTSTLKMARIASLDAATATDRMTNALRGFNMELNETNGQRIADVYSELAAVSATDVDELSTAMTKVASLASSANMTFENTSAFLSQILEVTREAPETAGTSLKTIIARATEVKKLYSKGELTGSDEEGEAIDVNNVSAALRSAGIDLNKFLVGDVGLDEIFNELASKWDTLDVVQQRY